MADSFTPLFVYGSYSFGVYTPQGGSPYLTILQTAAVPGGSSFDYIANNDSELSAILAYGGATLSNKTVGLLSSYQFDAPVFNLTGQTGPVTFASTDDTDKVIINQTSIERCNGLYFERINFVTDEWSSSAVPAVGYAPASGYTIEDVYFSNCRTGGSYRGNINSSILASDELPEYACIFPQFNVDGTLNTTTSAWLAASPNLYVGDLVADGSGIPLTFSNGYGVTWTVLPTGWTMTVSGGYITAISAGTAGASNGSPSTDGSILSKLVSWPGQAPYALRAQYGHKITNTAGEVGKIRYEDGSFDLLLNAFKAGPTNGHALQINRNDFTRIYQDYIAFGVGNLPTSQLPPFMAHFNRMTDSMCKGGDPFDPHGDAIQTFMTSGTTVDWEVDVVGNIYYQGNGRGSIAQYFLSDITTANNVGMTGRWIGNYNLGRDSGKSLNIDRIKNMLVMHNGGLVFDRTETNVTRQFSVGVGAGNTPLGYNYVANNIAEDVGYIFDATRLTVTGNISLGAEGATVSYTTAMPNWVDAPATFADLVDAIDTNGGTQSQAGYNSTLGLVDYINREYDPRLVHPGVYWASLTGQAASTKVWSTYRPNLSMEDVSVTVPSGAEFQVADDESGTNAQTAVVGPDTTTLPAGKWCRAAVTTSSVGSTSVEKTFTINGFSISFSARTSSILSYLTVDNSVDGYLGVGGLSTASWNRMLLAFMWRTDAYAVNANVWANNTGSWYARFFSSTSFRITLGNSSDRHTRWTVPAQPDGNMHLSIMSFDFTKTVREGTDTEADVVVKHWMDGSKLSLAASSNVDTTGTLTFTSFDSLGYFAESDGGGTRFDGKGGLLYVDFGLSSSGYTLPDINDPLVRDLFTRDLIGSNGNGPTGAQPKHCYYDDTLSNWNAGLTNRGSVSATLAKGGSSFT